MSDATTTPDAEADRESAHEAEEEHVDPGPEHEHEHGAPVTWSRGQKVLHPDRTAYPDVVRALRDDGYLVCVDLTVVDYLTHPGRVDLPAGVAPERFELVVSLLNHAQRARVRLRVQVPETEPSVASIVDLHPGADASEREAFDLFGVVFDGHPDLTRILMPEDWVGHPLRKDTPSGRIPVQFKDAPAAR